MRRKLRGRREKIQLGLTCIKGALCRFREEIKPQNFNIYNINKVIIPTNIYIIYLVTE